MRIKLTKDMADGFEEIHALHSEVINILRSVHGKREEVWVALRKKYDGKDFTNAHIDHKRNELVLPFENSK